MKTQIFRKLDNFNGWCRKYLIAKHLLYAVYACAYWNNKKTTVPLGKTKTKANFYLFDDIYYFSARKLCRDRNECKSFVAVLKLYGEWRQA